MSVHKFVKHLSVLDPESASGFTGATDSQIARLENLAQVLITGTYHEFLRIMGENTGPLFSGNELDMTIGSITRQYEEIALGNEPPPPLGELIVGIGPINNLTLRLSNGVADNGPLHAVDVITVGRRYADSLLKYMWQQSIGYENRVFRGCLSLTAEDGANYADREYSFASDLKLAKQWFSDSLTYCAIGEAGAMTIYHLDGTKDSIVIASHSCAGAEHIINSIQPHLPARPDGWDEFPPSFTLIRRTSP